MITAISVGGYLIDPDFICGLGPVFVTKGTTDGIQWVEVYFDLYLPSDSVRIGTSRMSPLNTTLEEKQREVQRVNETWAKIKGFLRETLKIREL